MSNQPQTDFVFSRDKYIQVLESQGLHAAITALHDDLRELEQECFETPEGYNAALYDTMRLMRSFSTELWDLGGRPGSTPKN